MTARRSFPRRSLRLALAVAVIVAGLGNLNLSHALPDGIGFHDSFDTLGPLAGTAPSDPYEIRNGNWEVQDLSDVLGGRRALVQTTRATTPNEPVVFVRDQSYHALTVQVTAALIDDVVPGGVGIVFRAPVLENQSADANNLYLFSAAKTGFVNGIQTGQIFALFKRVGQGYYMLTSKISETWTDLTRPHEYKVSMQGGHILAFVDGRLLIDHTDVPSPDQPTTTDPFPGLPFDEGTVGLRTSGARAWFDDLTIVADDAAEGRATALDAYASYGISGQTRKGTALQSSSTLRQMMLPSQLQLLTLDTGYVYGTPDFDQALILPLESPTGASIGATLRSFSKEGTVLSRARFVGFHQVFEDPMHQVAIAIDAAKIDTTVTAACDATTSAVDLGRAFVTIALTNGDHTPDTVIGPLPLASSYRPNTTVLEQPGLFKIIAHAKTTSTEPQRVEASALEIIFPDADASIPEVNVGGVRVLPKTSVGKIPVLEIEIANATAGRYCVEQVEADTEEPPTT